MSDDMGLNELHEITMPDDTTPDNVMPENTMPDNTISDPVCPLQSDLDSEIV